MRGSVVVGVVGVVGVGVVPVLLGHIVLPPAAVPTNTNIIITNTTKVMNKIKGGKPISYGLSLTTANSTGSHNCIELCSSPL